MALKLGEMLVNGGVITPAQLDEVLKCQVIFGGKLGTNLIEMGFLEEDDLAEFLSKKLGVSCAQPEQMNEIPSDVIKLIPRDIVQKYKVVPLRLDNRRLTIAIADPTDFAAIDEISFVTGYIIVPLVSPELRLARAMEKYYEIKRQIRYIPVSGGGRAKKNEVLSTAGPNETKRTEEAVAAYEADTIDLPLLSEITEADLPLVQEKKQPVPPIKPAPLNRFTVDTLSIQLAEARERNEIIDSLVTYFGQEFERTALFIVKGRTAEGMKAVVQGKEVAAFPECSVPLNEQSVLKVVVEGRSYYLGPIPDLPLNRKLMSSIGGIRESACLILPLIMMGRVVSVIFMDGGKREPGDVLLEMQKIVGKASMAFEILILKNKIMMT